MDSYFYTTCMVFALCCICEQGVAAGIKVPSRTLELPSEDSLDNSCPPGTAFFNKSQECHSLEGESPCGKAMLFVEDDEHPGFGKCVCKYGRHSDCIGKPVSYWEPTNQCYPLFEQGPCRKGEWLVPDKADDSLEGVECRKSPCVNSTALPKEVTIPSPIFTFIMNGTCHDTSRQAFCDQGQVAWFLGNDFTPKCLPSAMEHQKKLCYGSELTISKLLGPTN